MGYLCARLAGAIIRTLSDMTPMRKLITDTSDVKPSLALAFIAHGPALVYGIVTGDFLPAAIMASISTGYAGRCIIQGMKTGL